MWKIYKKYRILAPIILALISYIFAFLTGSKIMFTIIIIGIITCLKVEQSRLKIEYYKLRIKNSKIKRLIAAERVAAAAEDFDKPYHPLID